MIFPDDPPPSPAFHFPPLPLSPVALYISGPKMISKRVDAHMILATEGQHRPRDFLKLKIPFLLFPRNLLGGSLAGPGRGGEVGEGEGESQEKEGERGRRSSVR